MGGTDRVDLMGVWRRLSVRKRGETLRWLDHAGLALYLWEGIDEAQVDCPAELLSALELRVRANRLRTEDMIREFSRINHALQAARVRYVIVKGFSLSPEFSGEAWLRHQSDTDIVIPEDCIAAAESALAPLGYCRIAENTKGEIRLATQQTRTPRADDFLYGRQDHRIVEFHKELFEGVNGVNISPELEWQNHIEWRDCGTVRFPALDLPCRLLVQVLHCFSHLLHGWVRVGWLYELHRFSRTEESMATWAGLDGLVQYEKTRLACGLVLMLIQELFGSLPAKLKRRWVDPLPEPYKVWVQQFGADWALEDFPGNRLSLLIHRELVDSENEWRKFAIERRGRTRRAISVAALLDSPRVVRWLSQQVKYQISAFRWCRMLVDIDKHGRITAPKGS